MANGDSVRLRYTGGRQGWLTLRTPDGHSATFMGKAGRVDVDRATATALLREYPEQFERWSVEKAATAPTPAATEKDAKK